MADLRKDTGTAVQNCLTIIKRFLLCPICLDDFQNPHITPCAHVFCKYCIYEHVGKKRRAKCPLCNREFTRRALKTSDKFTVITRACENLITVYENEVGSSVDPSNFPTEQLHLSQELTQCVFMVDDNKPISPHNESRDKKESSTASKYKSQTPTSLLPRPKCASRSPVILRTASRVGHSRPNKSITKITLNSCSQDELTQPMSEKESTTERLAEHGFQRPISRRYSDQGDLFTLTQQTQPMTLESQEFTPVEGMSQHISHTDKITQIQGSASTGVTLQNTDVHVCSDLPPLPPGPPIRALSHKANSRKRITGSRFSDMPMKQCKIESSITESSSVHGIFKKTHEILCHVQPSGHLEPKIPRGGEGPGASSISSIDREYTSKCTFGSPVSPKSLSLKQTRNSSSPHRTNRPLRKNRFFPLNRRRNSLTRYHSLKSPGWSRWRKMYEDLRRRSSSVSLSFYSESGSALNLPSSHSNDSQHGHGIQSLKPWRSIRKSRQTIVSTPNVSLFDGQKHNSDNLVPMSSSKPCKFVFPLGGFFSRRRSRLSFSIHKPPVVTFEPTVRTKLLQVGSIDSTRASKVSPTVRCLDSAASDVISVAEVQCKDVVAYNRLHCSACGEVLVVDPDYFSALSSPITRSIANDRCTSSASLLSCSVSSTYWQAEYPGASSVSDVNLDKLVRVNQLYGEETDNVAQRKFTDAGCQTAIDIEPSKPVSMTPSVSHNSTSIPNRCAEKKNIPLSAMPATTSELLLPMTCSLVSSAEKSEGSSPAGQSSSKPCDEMLIQSSDDPNSTNVSSTYQTSSSEVMPTVDRERLQTECNELEAVVAALQQQLEAQVGELSPNTTAELLRAAGTEPLEDDEFTTRTTHVGKVSPQPGPSEASHTSGCKIGTTKAQASAFMEVLKAEGSVSQVPATELCGSDGLEIIPSSQADDDQLTDTSPIGFDGTELTAIPVVGSSTQYGHVSRVDPSQPPTTLTICDRISGSQFSQWGSQRTETKTVVTMMTELTECPETNLESQSVRPRESTCEEPSRIPVATLAVTGSNLSADQMMLLRSFCRRFKVSEHSRFIPGRTTHIVMAPESDRPRVVKRTLKYFMGILNRAWIVNTEWVSRCLAAGIVLDESPYEIIGDTVCGDSHEGPRRGRLRVPTQPLSMNSTIRADQLSNNGPFSGLWLCGFASLGLLSLTEFLSLALDGGADRVFENPADLAVAADNFVKTLSVPTKLRAVILTNHSPPDFDFDSCEKIYQKYGFPIISIDWMLNCISLYRRIPISEGYRICPSTKYRYPRTPLSSMNPPR